MFTMAYCPNCGNEVNEDQDVCLNCGHKLKSQSSGFKAPVDEGGFLWGLLGFCVSIVGLILFLVWQNERPLTAKAAGMGALISVGISIFMYIVVFALAGAASF
ncbi:MAG: zinc-ribbon domain-containing protein [Candidatus Izemoplasma sp.]|nr:zinc-ribbon domain-containing protein [Candidatus Izemoplasma sp.]